MGSPRGEAHGYLAKLGKRNSHCVVLFRGCDEQEESSCACAEDLPGGGACLEGALVPAVDRFVADPVDQTALQVPVLRQQPRQCVDIAGAETLPKLEGEVAHPLSAPVARPSRVALRCAPSTSAALRSRPV